MSVTEADIHYIQEKFIPLQGKRAWGASLGIGSFVTIEFGEPLSPTGNKGRTHGEWHLWIYNSAWRLEEENKKVLAASEDPRSKLEVAIQRLEGLAFYSVKLFTPALETVFTFEQGVVLRVFPIYSEEFEHWMLYTPDGNVLVAGPGSSWSYQSSSHV